MRFLAYDGESLTLRWPWEHTLDPDCRYGTIDPSDPPSDPPGHYPLRMHARVSPDGDLFALQPCWGWIRVGRFVEGGYIETEYGGTSTYRLRRLSARELEGSLDTQLEEAGIFVCRGIYEAEGVPIPPLPTSGSHPPSGGDVPSSRASRGAITATR
jgi:hypothetical protein